MFEYEKKQQNEGPILRKIESSHEENWVPANRPSHGDIQSKLCFAV